MPEQLLPRKAEEVQPAWWEWARGSVEAMEPCPEPAALLGEPGATKPWKGVPAGTGGSLQGWHLIPGPVVSDSPDMEQILLPGWRMLLMRGVLGNSWD